MKTNRNISLAFACMVRVYKVRDSTSWSHTIEAILQLELWFATWPV